MRYTNQKVAQMLHQVAVALQLQEADQFRIRAYEEAAATIEHYSSDVYEMWSEGKLEEVPGIGKSIGGYLDELFSTGAVEHFDELVKDIPPMVFLLDTVPGIGAKTARKLVAGTNAQTLDDMEEALRSGVVEKLPGFGAKKVEQLRESIADYKTKKNQPVRMLLVEADLIAHEFIKPLEQNPTVVDIVPLGSIRRRVPTVGDIDIAIATNEPDSVRDAIQNHPLVKSVEEEGEHKLTVLLHSNLRVDVRLQEPDSFASLVQHFTGSKEHNIQLRAFALEADTSISEYGITKGNKVTLFETEEDIYTSLGMRYIPPELREGYDEIQRALAGDIPELVTIKKIRGDLHVHSNYPIEPSHDLGRSSLEDLIASAEDLGYDYLGIADHNPAVSTHTEKEIEMLTHKRSTFIDTFNKKQPKVRLIKSMEIDILADGTIPVSDIALKSLDIAIAGIHSAHSQSKPDIMKRLRAAIEHPHIHIISHPTGRLLLEREGIEADWKEIFALCAQTHTVLEINASPKRLDLPDYLVRMAHEEFGVKFSIDTDAHDADGLLLMTYGVDTARRGWCTKDEIINTWNWKEILTYFSAGGKEV